MEKLIRDYKKRIKAEGDPGRATKEKAYLKSPFSFHGVSKPVLRQLLRDFAAEAKDLTLEQTLAIADQFWASKNHNEKTFGVLIWQKLAKKLDPLHLNRLQQILGECRTWDHTDDLAVNVVGYILLNYPKQGTYPIVRGWADSEILWVRRASIICHIIPMRSELGSLPDLFDTCNQLAGEKEFFIRKAIGWTLRETSKKHAIEVYDFINDSRDSLSGLSIREGARALPLELRNDIIPPK